jgi:hypothetical protein
MKAMNDKPHNERQGATMMGKQNLAHVLEGRCEDRDCELHNPFAIEDESSRLTAMAWFIAGGERMVEVMRDHLLEVMADRDARLDFLRFDYNHDDPEVLS